MSETQATTEAVVGITDDLDAFATEFFGGNKVDVPDAKPEVEQEQVNENTDEAEAEAQSGELTDKDEEEAEAELAKPTPPKSKVQERIDELVRQREEARRESDARIEAMRREFEAKLEALKPTTVAPKTDAEPDPDALDDNGAPKYALGEFDPQYIRDLTRFTLAQERAAASVADEERRRSQEQQTEAATRQESWNTKVESAKVKYPDLIEKGQTLLAGFANLPTDYAQYLATVLQSMEHGPDVLYYLSNNPAEARTIVNSGAQKATLALGRIEAKFVDVEAQKQLAKPKISKAPPPPTATARGTGGASPTVPADTDDLEAFEREFFRTKRK